MATEVAPTETEAQLATAVQRAVELLAHGHPVALPTETVYGLAADALEPEAVSAIFEAKERPFFDPLIVHLPERDWLERITAPTGKQRAVAMKLVKKFWPGPLTLVLPRQEVVPDIVTSGLGTVAVRMSAHPVFRRIATAFGGPLAAPSANRFGRISPTAASHVVEELDGRIPLVVDGGPTLHGVESTIVAVGKNGALQILRSGPIAADGLRAFGDVTLAAKTARPIAPGQLESHYSPATPMLLVRDAAEFQPEPRKRYALLAWRTARAPRCFEAGENLSPRHNLREAASRLFAAMRRLDRLGVDLIVAERVPETGLGVAIMDRLRKAAAR